jgi:hypothetical protein
MEWGQSFRHLAGRLRIPMLVDDAGTMDVRQLCLFDGEGLGHRWLARDE